MTPLEQLEQLKQYIDATNSTWPATGEYQDFTDHFEGIAEQLYRMEDLEK